MQLNEETPLQLIADAYPWIIDTVAGLDDRLKIAKTFVGRQLIKRSTIGDASRLSGYPVDRIIEELKKLIEKHGASDE